MEKITDFQVRQILQNCSYQIDVKNEWVQWVTGDTARTSLKSITSDEAKKIILAQHGGELINADDNWAKFDKNNPRHRFILSLLRQLQWTTKNIKYGEVADLNRLSKFLKSDKSPVKKPLKMMAIYEQEKIIAALSGIIKSRYK